MSGGGTLIGRYLVCDEIAHGGMATLHLGRMHGPAGFGRTVAIKRLHPQYAKDPDFVAMFVDEARLAARVHHPNVVQTLDVVVWERELLLVMEHVRGESLARLLKTLAATGDRMPLPLMTSIMTGALSGLHAAHEATTERGEPLAIVHRDVSPQNVLVGADGAARVLDFGIAKAAFRLHSTHGGEIRGKVRYMAPEQFDDGTATRQSDIFSASVMLWEMLTGRHLRENVGFAGVTRQMLDAEAPSVRSIVPDVPDAIDAIVMRGLARKPEQRFDTAAEMVAAIEAATRVATAREVGAFVEEVMADALATRDALVRAMEVATVDANPSRADTPANAPRATSEGTPPKNAEAVTEPFDYSSSRASKRPTSPGRRRLSTVVMVAVALVAVASSAFVSWRFRSRGNDAKSAAIAQEPTGSAATAPASSSPLVAPTEIPSASPSVTLAAPTAPSPTVSARVRTITRPAQRSVASKRAGCDPPFTIDPDGSKRMKVECL
jgi:serine/threonine-protein kinase